METQSKPRLGTTKTPDMQRWLVRASSPGSRIDSIYLQQSGIYIHIYVYIHMYSFVLAIAAICLAPWGKWQGPCLLTKRARRSWCLLGREDLCSVGNCTKSTIAARLVVSKFPTRLALCILLNPCDYQGGDHDDSKKKPFTADTGDTMAN